MGTRLVLTLCLLALGTATGAAVLTPDVMPDTPPPRPAVSRVIPPPEPPPLDTVAIDVEGPEAAEPETVDTGLEWLRPGEVSAEALGTGECTLLLSFQDRESGQPANMRVRLWRLDVPEGEAWTAGDQIQRIVSVSKSGARITQLPHGRYRADCREVLMNSEDPPEFVVGGRLSVARLYVDTPRKLRVRLRGFDEHGRSVRKGRFENGTELGTEQYSEIPEWACPREATALRGKDSGTGYGCRNYTGGARPWGKVDALEGGFGLGDMMQSSRENWVSRRHEFRATDCNLVKVSVDSNLKGDPTFVAPCIPLRVLAENVFLPDGTPAVEAGANVEAECRAVQATADRGTDAWRSVTIHVRVYLDGYRQAGCFWRYDRKGGRTLPRRVVMVPR